MSRNRVAIIDVGSNSIKLLVAEASDSGSARKVHFQVEETRIGEGMTEAPPALAPSAIDAGVAAIERLHQASKRFEPKVLQIVATSAVRDAQNREVLIEEVQQGVGESLRILSGAEEARLIGKGILQDPELNSLRDFTTIDLGGGSMECIQFENQAIFGSQSFDLGAVRLASLYVSDRNAPLADSDQAKISAYAREALEASSLSPRPSISTVILTGGVSAVLAEIHSKPTMDLNDARRYRNRVCGYTVEERISEMEIPSSRADIFPAAAVILCEALAYFQCDRICFSLFNLRFGLAAELIESQASERA